MKKNLKSILSGIFALAVSATLISVPFSASAEETASKKPFSFMSVGRDRSTNISWTMPNRDDITDVKVYREDGSVLGSVELGNLVTEDSSKIPLAKDETTGYVVLKASDGTVSSAAGKGIYIPYVYDAAGIRIVNGKRYVTNLEITYADGTVYKSAAISNPLADAGKMLWNAPMEVQGIPGWKGSVNNTTLVKFSISKDEKKDGEASLLVRSNQNSAISNTYQQLGPELTTAMESGKTYKFSYWEKGVNAGWYAVGYGGKFGNPKTEPTPGTSDWTQRSLTVTTGDSIADFRFHFERHYDALYIDNVELYEVDATTGERVEGAVNLIVNPSFETDVTAPADVSGTSAVLDENGNATISWSKSSDTAYTYIYNEFEGKKNVYRVTTGTSITIPNAEYGDKYTIVATDTLGNEAEGISVTVKKGDSKIPLNLIFVGRDRSGTVSWKMPNREDIADVKLYDGDGNEIASVDSGNIFKSDLDTHLPLVKDNGVVKIKNADETYSFVSGTGVFFNYGSLTNGNRYVTNLEITYTDGTVYRGAAVSNVLNNRATNIWSGQAGTQSITKYNWEEAVNEKAFTEFRVSKDIKKEGEASLLIRNNLNRDMRNTYQQLGPVLTTAMESGKTYEFSYWEYAVNAGWYAVGYGGRWGEPKWTGTPETSGWKQRSFTFTVGDSASDIRFQFDRNTEAMYIDLVEIYELDENGNRTGENLVKNPSFETDITAPAEVTNSKAVADGNGNVTVSFTKASDAAYIYVYEDFEGEPNVVAASKGDSITIPAQEIGKEYKIVSVDELGNESEGVTVKSTVVNFDDPYLYTELVIEDANGVPEYVDANTEYTISTTVTNQTAGDDFAPVVIAAVYDGDGKLIDVDLQTLTTAEGASNEFKATVKTPNDFLNSYTVKAFLWEGLSNLAPIASGYLE